MSDIRRQDEPSMEEILSSIRRIIAEDADSGGTTKDAATEQDILELTDKVESDGSVVSLVARLAPRGELRETSQIAVAPYEPPSKAEPPAVETPNPMEPVTEGGISPNAAAASVAPYEPPSKAGLPAVETPNPTEPVTEGVISPSAAAASVAALAELARETPRAASTAGVPTGGDRALEDVTRELLKPLLRVWLDANLPPLIERIVRDEIARLARAARGS